MLFFPLTSVLLFFTDAVGIDLAFTFKNHISMYEKKEIFLPENSNLNKTVIAPYNLCFIFIINVSKTKFLDVLYFVNFSLDVLVFVELLVGFFWLYLVPSNPHSIGLDECATSNHTVCFYTKYGTRGKILPQQLKKKKIYRNTEN